MFDRKSVLLGLAFFMAALLPLQAQEKKKPWKDTAEFSLVSTNGNSKTDSISGKNTFIYNWPKWVLEAIVGGLGTKSEGRTTAEQYFGSGKLGYKLSDVDYLFEKYRWDKDRFAGIDARHDLSFGYGRQFIKGERHNLLAELGAGYVNEDRRGEPKNDFASGRVYGKYGYKISETADFSQTGEYLYNFEDSSDFRFNSESALTSKMSTHLALKVSYEIKHVGDPPKGFGQTDTTTKISIIFDY